MPKIKITISNAFITQPLEEANDEISVYRLVIWLKSTREAIVGYLNNPQELGSSDEKEISRGNNYKYDNSPDDKNKLQSIEGFKNYLKSNNISEENHNLIISILLQNRLALPDDIANQVNTFLIELGGGCGIESSPLKVSIESRKTTLLFDKKGAITIHSHIPIDAYDSTTEALTPVGHAEIEITVSKDQQIKFKDIEIELEDDGHLPVFKMMRGNLNGLQEKSTYIVNFVRNNPWKTAALLGSVILGGLGAILTFTGFLSPAGLVLSAIGYTGMHLSLTGTALLATNLAVPSIGGAIVGFFANGVTKLIKKINPTEHYSIKPTSSHSKDGVFRMDSQQVESSSSSLESNKPAPSLGRDNRNKKLGDQLEEENQALKNSKLPSRDEIVQSGLADNSTPDQENPLQENIRHHTNTPQQRPKKK